MRLLAVLGSVLLPACSFFGVHGPGGQTTFRDVSSCDTSPALPIVDTLSGLALGIPVGAVYGIDDHGGASYKYSTAAIVGTLVASPWLFAAVTGFVKNRRCVVAREKVRDESLQAARRAAKHDDCQTVEQLETDVLELDPEFHDRWFVVDADIATCPTHVGHPIRGRVGSAAVVDAFNTCAQLHDIRGSVQVRLSVEDHRIFATRVDTLDDEVPRLDQLRACLRVKLAGTYWDDKWKTQVLRLKR